jgi:hypothetical protein
MRKGDAIGEWLGRQLLRFFSNLLGRTPEERERFVETAQQNDPLKYLGITNDPPGIWKSILFWVLLIVGMGGAWYMSLHQASGN